MYEVIGKLYNARHTSWRISLSGPRGQPAQLRDESRDASQRPGEAAATRDGVVAALNDDDQRPPLLMPPPVEILRFHPSVVPCSVRPGAFVCGRCEEERPPTEMRHQVEGRPDHAYQVRERETSDE